MHSSSAPPDVSGNGFALVATRGPIATLLDTVVTGARRILAADGGTSADIDCASAGTSHPCRMNVSGVATFDGTMRVKLKNGYVPHVGEQFIAINAIGGRTGTFATIIPPSPNVPRFFVG